MRLVCWQERAVHAGPPPERLDRTARALSIQRPDFTIHYRNHSEEDERRARCARRHVTTWSSLARVTRYCIGFGGAKTSGSRGSYSYNQSAWQVALYVEPCKSHFSSLDPGIDWWFLLREKVKVMSILLSGTASAHVYTYIHTYIYVHPFSINQNGSCTYDWSCSGD